MGTELVWVKDGRIVSGPGGGAKQVTAEIVETARGHRVLASDYYSLRRDAYPDIRDQLDALWKGGADKAAMQARIMEVKTRYPIPP